MASYLKEKNSIKLLRTAAAAVCCKLKKPNYKIIVDDFARRDDPLALGALATSGRLLLQARTKGSGAGRQNKGRNVSWRNGSLRRKPGLDYSMLHVFKLYAVHRISLPVFVCTTTIQRWVSTPVLSTCPLHTNSGCGKERRILVGPW